MLMKSIQKTIGLSEPQMRFRRSRALFKAFIGGRGAGKSWIGCYDLLVRAKRGHTYLITSPTAPKLYDETFPTFEKIAKELGCWVPHWIRMSPYPTVTLSIGAKVRFRSCSEPLKLAGPNLSGVLMDEAGMCEELAYITVIGCLREQGEQGWLTATTTPKGKAHWTYRVFATGRENTDLVRASTASNPFNPREFYRNLVGQYSEALIAQELHGEFLDLEGEYRQVIPTSWIEEAMARPQIEGPIEALGCDVARGGNARTVLARRSRNCILPLIKLPGSSTPNSNVVVTCIKTAIGGSNCDVMIDSIGIGAAVVDTGLSQGLRAIPINFANRTDKTDLTGFNRFMNIRAFAYWSLREALDPNGFVKLVLPRDEQLAAELAAIHYEHTLSGIKIQSKDEISKTLGRSPDCADAVALACLIPESFFNV